MDQTITDTRVFFFFFYQNWKHLQTTIEMLLNWWFLSLIEQKNIVGKGENAGYQHFLLFPQRFQKTSYTGSLKLGIVW